MRRPLGQAYEPHQYQEMQRPWWPFSDSLAYGYYYPGFDGSFSELIECPRSLVPGCDRILVTAWRLQKLFWRTDGR